MNRAVLIAMLTAASILVLANASLASNVTLNGSGQIYWDTQFLGSTAGNTQSTPAPAGPNGNTYTLGVPGQYAFLDQFSAPQTAPLVDSSTGLPFENSGSPVGTYAFQDAYQFSIGSASSGDVLAVSLGLQTPLQGVFNISNLQFRLYEVASASGAPGLTIPGDGSVISYWQGIAGNDNGVPITTSFNNLSAGTYVLDIAGTADGTSGGTYVGQLNLSPVPLPATLWLMASGIGGLALAARRRQIKRT